MRAHTHSTTSFKMARSNGFSTPARTVREGLNDLDDKRIKSIRPLIPPQILMEDYPLTMKAAATVLEGRKGCEEIVAGHDDRLLVVVGPCSVHDIQAALEYAKLLKAYADEAAEDLFILMRVYFEKPRTTVGWKGLINDPQLNGSFQINKGLRLARGLLLEIAEMGLPAGCEFLDTISPQYTGDLVSWGAIGARTTESQVHRELASGLSVPIGFKNGTDGSLQIAIDAIGSAASSHSFLSVTKQGISAIVETDGNPSCHVILRGANSGPNFSADHVEKCAASLTKAKLAPRVMIDCSHGNSEKKHERQVIVADSIAEQLGNSRTASNIIGVMIESHLVAGKQSIPAEGPVGLTYGQSVTDACIDWQTTVQVLDTLRKGVHQRRTVVGPRQGLNRALNVLKERDASLEGRKAEFNDPNQFASRT
ncbi:3-deoxy-7-phosphoheptulonate synthase [Microbotryum lychnidis-dioicae p1A1 Lamole]|uniref:3-deoxy-7-phosphoheptulonate synthase n=1 Tax=Microbotryum lychnidis-dioicae (strain p1A1 Lamole / MvSl-1064) TaxID=683840 RepID=U5HA58_USTV1|nr:3-deoxy-7-phosphoheptulonate synthase [Microbotryum lychnidis-dioicae p1A1 Lamole]|eukprot:KDE05598.1 3-deoxy-7-phosphoheptulonate synthase [Microbotryum lychnidis-dioicae p1A1 Lamole]